MKAKLFFNRILSVSLVTAIIGAFCGELSIPRAQDVVQVNQQAEHPYTQVVPVTLTLEVKEQLKSIVGIWNVTKYDYLCQGFYIQTGELFIYEDYTYTIDLSEGNIADFEGTWFLKRESALGGSLIAHFYSDDEPKFQGFVNDTYDEIHNDWLMTGPIVCVHAEKISNTSTTTTAPDIVPELELTYPVGESPKVFTIGWVFGAQCTYTDEDGIEVDISDQVSWGGTGKFNPNKGSRSYPTFNLPEKAGQHTIELSVEINGEEYKKEFQVEAVPATDYARVADEAVCKADAHGCIACPHPTKGPITAGSPNVSIRGKPAARVGDPGIAAACCGPNNYTIVAGDEDVLIDGKPAARIGDQTTHCGGSGRIVEGSPGAGSKVIKSDHHTCKIPTKAVPQADEGGTILGKVTDTVGTGIVGVGVMAYGEINIDVWGTITDENGEYQITGLPDDNFRIHFWGGNWAYNDGYLSSWYNDKSSMDAAETVTITGSGSVTGIDATLPAGGSISGTVKDASGGGVEKATVGAYGESGGMSFGYTDENGVYQIAGLEDDSYQMYCDAGSQGYISEWYNDKSSQSSSDSVTVTSPNQTSGIDFTLAGAGGISGTVKDTSGNGIGEVYVKAFGESTSVTGMGATDENGAYEILGISDDSYRVQFQGESQGYSDQWYSSKSSWDTAEHVTVTAPNKTTGIDAELPPAGATTTTTPQQPCTIEEIYGEYSEQTELLRYFRDNVLNKTPEGQELIKLYYEWNPAIVRAMEEDDRYKEDVKELIDGALLLIRGNH